MVSIHNNIPNLISAITNNMPTASGTTSHASPPGSPIFTMPQEIFDMVFQLCDKKDLDNVRLVFNKELCGIVMLAWSLQMPHDLRCRLTVESLDRLVGLTANPAIASLVKSVSLCFTKSCEVKNPLVETRSKSATPRRRRMGSASYWLQKQRLVVDVDCHNLYAKTQNEYLSTEHLKKQLEQALQNLKTHSNDSVTLGFHKDDRTRLKLVDKTTGAQLERDGESRQLLVFGMLIPATIDDPCFAARAMTCAVKASEYPTKSAALEFLSTSDLFRPADSSWYNMQPTSKISMKVRQTTVAVEKDICFLKLKHVCFVPRESDQRQWENHWTHLKSMIREDMHWVASVFSTLIIEHSTAEYEFLDLHFDPDIIKHLELSHIYFNRPKKPVKHSYTAVSFFQHLKELPELENLVLEEISDQKHSTKIQDEKVHWKGKDEIQAGLSSLIGKMATWRWSW